ncbi:MULTISPECIES: DUF3618 domain-containing protein [unclassified Methylobacterium]|uniref:DUF3618 domain-containing protein n=1 Tax=unclassified Methylobacterium TaxID=2615210 RepID=UPI0006FBFD82|nr:MULTISPECIES: DUF3618 domain-containing protein [unclassified Methylobacterium]KQP74991.1 hypothetical protein ASF60_07520 [Methylobacterium sp. Leaf113]KQP81040.1 hypothetical protein ASF57_15685 [Methylobacterium sp. Leaf117]MCK2055445.1 DUF3618 domain-containing protein [Methylobacterium sp. 37f]
MTESLNDLEKDIEASRARLDQTIDQIQDRLSVSSIVDEMLGNARQTPLSGAYDGALEAVRRNPVPVLLIAAGIGWLLHRMSTNQTAPAVRRRGRLAVEGLPVTKTGADRVYDPDLPTQRPAHSLSSETQI